MVKKEKESFLEKTAGFMAGKDDNEKKKLMGIGGWLIIPTISLFIVAGLYSYLTIIYGITIMSSVDLLLFFLFLAVAAISIYTLVLEFKKSKHFPKWFKMYLWFSVFAVVLMSLTDEDYTGVFGGIIYAIIWTWYINVSVRVKNTFRK